MDYWGGAKGYVGPPLKLLGEGAWPPPPGPPSSYAYASSRLSLHHPLPPSDTHIKVNL